MDAIHEDLAEGELVFFINSDVPPDVVNEEGPVEDCECAHCGKPVAAEDEQSTYCGTMHIECAPKHARTCGACAKDF